MNKALKLKIIEIFGTQADFAQALGVDESYISRVIRGRRMLDSTNQNRWSKLLKCKSETIFGNQKVKSG
jgi:transcriptional regulator with XRE-family HTH domain